MTDSYVPFMFEGRLVGDRLSNETWLWRECKTAHPEFFDPDNPWTAYVRKGFVLPSNVEHEWKLQEMSPAEAERRLDGFSDAFLMSLPNDAYYAVLGWMMSNILAEVPGD